MDEIKFTDKDSLASLPPDASETQTTGGEVAASPPLPGSSATVGSKVTTMEDLKALANMSEEEATKYLMSEQDPGNVFAGMFYIYFPRLAALTDKMSNKALRRLLRAIHEVPLNDKPYKMLKKEEKEAFEISFRLQQSKYMMGMAKIVDDWNAEEKRKNAAASEVPVASEISVDAKVEEFLNKEKGN